MRNQCATQSNSGSGAKCSDQKKTRVKIDKLNLRRYLKEKKKEDRSRINNVKKQMLKWLG